MWKGKHWLSMNFVNLAFLLALQASACLSSGDNSSQVHENVDKLIHYIQHGYDKTTIPKNPDGGPLGLKIDIYVTSIEPIDQVNMKFTVQMYLRQYWNDESLKFNLTNGSCTDYVSLHPDLITKVWSPDTYIENEVSKDVRSRALVIWADGRIALSERVNVEAYCPLDLRRYPIDVQHCVLKLQSYSYAACELRYSWFYEGQESSLRVSKAIHMPDYDITGLFTRSETEILKTGSYSRLLATFQFTRRLMFILMRDYIPAIFIVMTSWLSFYIDPAASPARVSLAVVTVLSISSQLSSTFRSTPEVSYIKAIDYYLIGCFFFVFTALLEYGFIHSYGEEVIKTGMRKAGVKRTKYWYRGAGNAAMATVEFEKEQMNETTNDALNSGSEDKMKREQDSFSRHRSNHESNLTSDFIINDPHHTQEGQGEVGKKRFMARLFEGYLDMPSADSISRILFPTLFFIFNLFYWVLLLGTNV